jgi:predicted signal transduction protein with EAL and GGDEF domain
VCRLGGDEFTVILGMTTPQGTAVVARNILRSIAQPMTLQGHEVSVTSSIGIAMFPTDSDDIQALLKNADTAMYRAKARGNFYQFYEASMHAQAVDRFALEGQLRRAIERQEFEVYYQPQVDLGSGRLAGLEALVRWRRPDGQVILAADFIALAEESGLLVPIGEWVLNAACAQMRVWRDRVGLPVRVAVNLSSRQVMRANLPEVVRRALDQARLEPKDLELELTEHIFTQDIDTTTASVERLRGMGVGLTIDDFGTGYSSLSVLKRFAIGTVKIGHAFVRDVTDNGDADAIVTASIAMAHHLGVKVIAEGVERPAQVEWLRAHGADVIQGEVVAPPMPVGEVAAFLGEGWRFDLPRAA